MADEISQITAVQPQFPIETSRKKVLGELWLIAKRATAVAGSGSYSSNFVNVVGFSRVTGTCLFNEDGTLKIEQSNDGVNVDYTTSEATTGGTTKAVSVELICPFVRITWDNGTANDTTTHKMYIYAKGVS